MTTIPEELVLDIIQEAPIRSTPQRAFDALLAGLGPRFMPSGNEDIKLKLEPWPGGRWFRDLGQANGHDAGHLWGHVQVIKAPTLIELVGPMFMSYPAVSHIQFRISEHAEGQGDAVLLSFRHRAMGLIDPEHREGVTQGWSQLIEGIKSHAELN